MAILFMSIEKMTSGVNAVTYKFRNRDENATLYKVNGLSALLTEQIGMAISAGGLIKIILIWRFGHINDWYVILIFRSKIEAESARRAIADAGYLTHF